MKSFKALAQSAYAAYCEQAGGLTFDGKPLPTYDELGEERQQCWVAAAKHVTARISALLRGFDQLARSAYTAYCEQAGSLTFDGKPLPTYDELGEERQQCWVAAAKRVAAEMAALH